MKHLSMILTVLLLGGCKGMARIAQPWTWFSSSETTVHQTSGAAVTYSSLHSMAMFAFVPGLLIIIGTVLPWTAFLKPFSKLGWSLLLIGLGIACIPLALKPLMWLGFAAGASVFVLWIIGHARQLMHGNGIAKALTPINIEALAQAVKDTIE